MIYLQDLKSNQIHSNMHIQPTPAPAVLEKCCIFYPHLSLETVFPTPKLTQICCINMKISFLDNWKFNHKMAPHLLNTYQA